MNSFALKLAAALGLLVALATAVRAAELIYVHEVGCPYCIQWERQIGPIYGKTDEARRAPLRAIEKRDAALTALKLARPVRYTPTFILMEKGVELGRIEGYPGEDFFWAMLGRLLDKLPADAAPDSAAAPPASGPGEAGAAPRSEPAPSAQRGTN